MYVVSMHIIIIGEIVNEIPVEDDTMNIEGMYAHIILCYMYSEIEEDVTWQTEKKC